MQFEPKRPKIKIGHTICRLLITLAFSIFNSYGQVAFEGTFQMNFNTSTNIKSDLGALIWSIDKPGKGNRVAMEIEDEMKKKGVNKRVLFDFNDSSWTMVMAIKNIRQGTKIMSRKMYRDSCSIKKINKKEVKEPEIISGLKCKKIIITNAGFESEVWITDQYNYDLSKMYELMLHCGLMDPMLKKGKWYEYHIRKKGMIIKVRTQNKETGENYSLQIDHIRPGNISPIAFDLKDYKISIIEEGKNCAAVDTN